MYANEATLDGPLDSSRIRTRETLHMIRGLELSAPLVPPYLQED